MDEERERPPMSAEMFATLVVARLRSIPGITLEARHGLEFDVTVGAERRSGHLDSYYDRYRAEPGALSPLVQQFIDGLVSGIAEPERPESFEQVKHLLLPLPVTSAEWQSKRDVGLRLVVRPLVQDLGMSVVLDRPGELQYVVLEDIPRWGVEIARVYGEALVNADRLAGRIPFTQQGSGGEVILIDRAPDGLSGARLLAPSRLEAWASLVSGELVLGLPTRDFVIGFGRDHPAFADLREQVRRDAETRENGLYGELLLHRNGELVTMG